MSVIEKALSMLEVYPLCDNCLGRQFALLGRGIENNSRGNALKLTLTLQASAFNLEKAPMGSKMLKLLVMNGFSIEAEEALRQSGKRVPRLPAKICFLCEDKILSIASLLEKALDALSSYEYSSFLVGVELPVAVEEREDEFKAAFGVAFGESIRHEFGRLLGKRFEERTGKLVEYMKPDVTLIVNPFTENIRLQVNPIFVAGRYRKLVRDIPQSKWYCSCCRGRGCEKCNGTGKLYPDSVEEFVSGPVLAAAEGEKTAFHASGREDIDARMLGRGRPFVVEVSKPKKRSLDLARLKEAINKNATGKVEVSTLRITSKNLVGKLKMSESSQKKYRVLIEFEKEILDKNLPLLEQKLTGTLIKQQTPRRVLHRRADLIRERYIYKVKVRMLSPRRVEMQVRCQGGLYVKELVSGDDGRTMPSVSELLGNRAKTLKLDVLNVLLDDE
ncbi:TPA: tRNA pseudouridine(54/55) synthase Pus10 [Candidatus Bathyarchaeota archaeon]|nr:tRNA pseudouridine(54/55) synthase Pus10 [Candidatus Bathyarchaeota archaeon]HIJ08508.1 tRNA pseudouridine(54/55) synthase Pus10 [Candidatus Bathyarchaeota archaeon]